MRKKLLTFGFSGLLFFSALISAMISALTSAVSGVAFASDCHDFSGSYELISATEQTQDAGFSFPTKTFVVEQSVCDSITLSNGSRKALLIFDSNGKGAGFEEDSFFHHKTLTIQASVKDPQILDLVYSSRNRWWGTWAHLYEYRAQFKRK